MRRPRARLFVAVAAGLLAAAALAQVIDRPVPDNPSPDLIRQLRDELAVKRRERQSQADVERLLEPTRLTERPPDSYRYRDAWFLRVTSELDRMGVVLTLRRIDSPADADPEAGFFRHPISLRGEFWLALPPGRWSIAVAAGSPERAVELPPFEIEARKNEPYALELSEKIEQELRAMILEQAD